MVHQGLLAAALCLVSIVLQVQTAAPSRNYYVVKTCPFPTDPGGNLGVGELPQIVGIPVTDLNFKAYLAQNLCKGMCHNPVTPLEMSSDISNMLEANSNFECQNKNVKIQGTSAEEICASFNEYVQKPACEVVDDTIVCIVDAFPKSIYVNIFVQPCAVEFDIYVVKATETFGDLQCNLVENKHATTTNNVFELDLLSNSKTNAKKKLVFAPESDAKNIVSYKTLTRDMSAAKDFDHYKKMLETWQKLCGKTTGHSATTVCQSVTANMVKVCKLVRTPKVSDEIMHIKTCVNRNYGGQQQETMEAEADAFWCGLKQWEMKADMKKCVDSKEGKQTGEYSFDIPMMSGVISYIYSGVDFVTPPFLKYYVNIICTVIKYYMIFSVVVCVFVGIKAVLSSVMLLSKVCLVFTWFWKLYKDEAEVERHPRQASLPWYVSIFRLVFFPVYCVLQGVCYCWDLCVQAIRKKKQKTNPQPNPGDDVTALRQMVQELGHTIVQNNSQHSVAHSELKQNVKHLLSELESDLKGALQNCEQNECQGHGISNGDTSGVLKKLQTEQAPNGGIRDFGIRDFVGT